MPAHLYTLDSVNNRETSRRYETDATAIEAAIDAIRYHANVTNVTKVVLEDGRILDRSELDNLVDKK